MGGGIGRRTSDNRPQASTLGKVVCGVTIQVNSLNSMSYPCQIPTPQVVMYADFEGSLQIL